jgi:hypothetical protein
MQSCPDVLFFITPTFIEAVVAQNRHAGNVWGNNVAKVQVESWFQPVSMLKGIDIVSSVAICCSEQMPCTHVA